MVVMCRCLLPACPGGQQQAHPIRVAVSRGDAVLALAGLRGDPAGRRSSKAGRVLVHKSMPSRGRVTLSGHCEPAALAKQQRAACQTRVLASASTQWDVLPHLVGFRTVMKQRPARRGTSSRHRKLGGSHRVHPHASRMDTGEETDMSGEISRRKSPHSLQRQARCLCWEPRRARRVATTVPRAPGRRPRRPRARPPVNHGAGARLT